VSSADNYRHLLSGLGGQYFSIACSMKDGSAAA
jgi:hypothetical protein